MRIPHPRISQPRTFLVEHPLVVLTVAFTIAFLALAELADAADPWSGVWNTQHRFGNPQLDLAVVNQDGEYLVKGSFSDDSGERLGFIRGEVSQSGQGDEVWAGSFRNIGDGSSESRGRFSVALQSDQASFSGWYRNCSSISCSKRYRWTGEHS